MKKIHSIDKEKANVTFISTITGIKTEVFYGHGGKDSDHLEKNLRKLTNQELREFLIEVSGWKFREESISLEKKFDERIIDQILSEAKEMQKRSGSKWLAHLYFKKEPIFTGFPGFLILNILLEKTEVSDEMNSFGIDKIEPLNERELLNERESINLIDFYGEVVYPS